MARLIVYFAHPGLAHSRANVALAGIAGATEGISFVDLYASYPRHEIDVHREQERLKAHEVVLLQVPIFWYSCPGLLKDWIDLTLQHGFAYGAGGDALKGKILMLAVSAGGSEGAYQTEGYQHYPLRTFLTPFEQTARLCQMRFAAPYVLFGAIRAAAEPQGATLAAHQAGYARLIEAIRDDRVDWAAAEAADTLTAGTLDQITGGT